MCSIAILLNVACFLFSVCLAPFNFQLNANKRNQDEVMASIGVTMHHDPSLRPSVCARHGTDTQDLLSNTQVP